MDAALPSLVCSTAGAPGNGEPSSASGQPLRVMPDRPVLLALDVALQHGSWSGYAVVPLRFSSLSAAIIAKLTPAAVAIPLWSRGADAVQMLQRLAEFGYSGPVEVHTPPLPNLRMVMAELTQVAAGLRVSLLERPEDG